MLVFAVAHLDYGDVIYDNANNERFSQKSKSCQDNACLALSGAIRKSSREKLHRDLSTKN